MNMPLPHLAKAPYLKADHVQNDEVVTITKKPWIVKAEDASGPYKRDRAYIGIKVDRDGGEHYTWGLNVTTYERLLEAFGADAELWVGKKVRISKETQTVRGEQREVLFGQAYKEPQKRLDVAPAEKPVGESAGSSPQEQGEVLALFSKLPPEAQKTLLQTLREQAKPVAQ